ncbi:Conserved oligomeric Golgi complex subunit [Entophlyctis luteolus]|nr:Conserved oligomeric Golgi complex subunit [Entophlyctis luteolus]
MPSASNSSSTGATVAALLANPEYRDFALDSFDPVEYANRIIQAPDGTEYHRTDIAAALGKLSFSIEQLNRELHNQVAAHYEDLLEQVTGLDTLETSLEKIHEGIINANSSFARVKSKIRDTYSQIKQQTDELELVQEGAEVLRNVHRFLGLNKRLEGHMREGSSTGISQAAACIKEIETLLHEVDLVGIEVVDPELAKIQKSKSTVASYGDKQLMDGLNNQNQIDIAAGLQIFYNLGQISSRAKLVVDSILEEITTESQQSLNVQLLTKEIKDLHAQTVQGKKGVEVVNVSEPVYTERLWKRLESLMDKLHDNTVKVYVLERVLSRKKDPFTQVAYLDHVLHGMDENIVKYFWKGVSQIFEKEIRSAVKCTVPLFCIWIIFQLGYPKLLRLFHDMFVRLNVTIATVPGTTAPVGAGSVVSSQQFQSPTENNVSAERVASESAVLLKALSSFETAYLRESLARILEPVNQAFPEKPASGSRISSAKDDVDKLLNAISRELEISKFDSHLLKSVAKNAAKAINMYSIRSEHLVASDSSLFSVANGTAVTANSSQLLNIDIVNCLWALSDGIWKALDDFDEEQSVVTGIFVEAVEGLHKLIQSVAESLIAGITREMELSIVKIHKEDFNKNTKSAADQSLGQYIIELGGKMRYKSVGTRLIDFFLRQASIIRPMNTEQGKLKLTTDMTQFEFILNQWISPTGMKLEAAMGSSYKALRAYRQLLFLDTSQVAAMHHTADIPRVIVAHHLIVRAHPLIHLPITAFGWTELGYSNWLDIHREEEAIALLGQCLNMYVDDVRKQGGREYRVEFVVARNLLKLA